MLAVRLCLLRIRNPRRLFLLALLLFLLSTCAFLYVDQLFDPSRYLIASPHLSALPLRVVSWVDYEAEDAFFQPRTKVVSPLPEFLITPSHPCKESSFFAVIVPSPPGDFQQRGLIRKTWAGGVKTRHWPGGQELEVSGDVFFVLGVSLASTASQKVEVAKEGLTHQDLIVGDYVDSYRNLTLKTLTGLRWVGEKCAGTKFVLKVDQDTLVDFPRMASFLHSHHSRLTNSVLGSLYYNSERLNKGKWEVSPDEYPFAHYPTFAGGPCYVISTDAVTRMVNLSRYLPFFRMEDVQVTGIVARAARVRHLHVQQLKNWYKDESLCVFLREPRYQVSLTQLKHDELRYVWQSLEKGQCLPPVSGLDKTQNT